MGFADELDIRFEVQFDDVWVNLGDQVDSASGRKRLRSVSSISRGRSDEASQVSPASCTVTLDNTDGSLTPGNPQSPNWPFVDVDAPARVSVPNPGGAWLSTGADRLGRMATPDSAGLSVVGDLFVAVEFTPDVRAAKSGPGYEILAAKWDDPSNASWLLAHNPLTGVVLLAWTADGVTANTLDLGVTNSVDGPQDRQIVGVFLDVDNGAGAAGLELFRRGSWSDPWESVGTALGSVTTSVFDSTAPVELGLPADHAGFYGGESAQRIHRFEMRSGDSTGTVVASPDLSAEAEGAASFDDGQGNTWTVVAPAEVTDREYRIWGSVGAWKPSWPNGDIADPTVDHPGFSLVEVEIGGPLRRLNQTSGPAETPLRRSTRSLVGHFEQLLGWWPMDETTPTDEANGSPVRAELRRVSWSDGYATGKASERCGWLLTGFPAVGAFWPWAADIWVRVDREAVDTMAAGDRLLLLRVAVDNGAVGSVEILVQVNGTLAMIVRDLAGAQLANQTITSDRTWVDSWVRVSISGDPNEIVGSAFWWDLEGSASSFSMTSHGASSMTAVDGLLAKASLLPDSGTIQWGNLLLWDGYSLAVSQMDHAAAGWVGETPAERFDRITTEAGIPATYAGSDGPLMGPQPTATPLAIARECADVGGMLTESVAFDGLHFRTSGDMVNQAPALTLDAAQSQISNPFAIARDDQGRVDQVTATGANTARTVTEEGVDPLAPRFPISMSANVASQTQLLEVGGWRLYLGSSSNRSPRITVNLAVAPELIPAVLALQAGDLIRVVNLPAQYPAGTLDLIVQGDGDAMGSLTWEWAANCTPGDLWETGVFDLSLADTAGAELVAPIADSATTFDVTTTSGPEWITTATFPAVFPFAVLIGDREQVTVTAISGTAPQSFTVTRASTPFPHAAGASVALAAMPVFGP